LNLSGLTDFDENRRRLIDDFYALEGLQHFSDSDEGCDPEDKGEVFLEKNKVAANKEETKVMTRDECKKANIAPSPAYKAPYPEGRRARSLSPKLTSSRTTKTASPKSTPKVPHSPKVAPQQATHGQESGVKVVALRMHFPSRRSHKLSLNLNQQTKLSLVPSKRRPLLSLQLFRPPRHQ